MHPVSRACGICSNAKRPAMILFALSLIEKDYSSIEEVDADLKFVCKEVTEAAISH